MSPDSPRRPQVGPPRALVVDDEPDLTEVVAQALVYDGWEVRTAADGAEAVAVAGEFRPDAVVLDVMLPDFDGLEVLRRLRANDTTRLLPVVILTTSQEDEDLIISYSLGANSYVHKPVDINQFVAAVRQLGLFWLIVNDAPPQL